MDTYVSTKRYRYYIKYVIWIHQQILWNFVLILVSKEPLLVVSPRISGDANQRCILVIQEYRIVKSMPLLKGKGHRLVKC